MVKKHLLVAPFSEALPAQIVFRGAEMPDNAEYPSHRHSWGEFVYSFSGVMEIRVAGEHYLVPPQYGIWLAPHVEHIGQNRRKVQYSSLYVSGELCARMPDSACALVVTPLVRAMLDHLRQQPPALPQTDDEQRLLQVLLDQLAQAPRAGSYLPGSDDPVLGKVLHLLNEDPGDARSLAELAAAVNSTARTLMRRSQRDLGMTLAEWRQRLRVTCAIALLEQGATVERIALDLGYASSSAFITMFRRLAGVTPDEYRKSI